MLRDMSALAPFSLLADCAHVVGMLVVLKDDVENYSRAHETVVASRGAPALPFLFGVVIYCYEGISMILPIQDAMKDKSKVRLARTRMRGHVRPSVLLMCRSRKCQCTVPRWCLQCSCLHCSTFAALLKQGNRRILLPARLPLTPEQTGAVACQLAPMHVVRVAVG